MVNPTNETKWRTHTGVFLAGVSVIVSLALGYLIVFGASSEQEAEQQIGVVETAIQPLVIDMNRNLIAGVQTGNFALLDKGQYGLAVLKVEDMEQIISDVSKDKRPRLQMMVGRRVLPTFRQVQEYQTVVQQQDLLKAVEQKLETDIQQQPLAPETTRTYTLFHQIVTEQRKRLTTISLPLLREGLSDRYYQEERMWNTEVNRINEIHYGMDILANYQKDKNIPPTVYNQKAKEVHDLIGGLTYTESKELLNQQLQENERTYYEQTQEKAITQP